MKATEQYFPVVPFIMLYTVFLTPESVDEILKSENSNESQWAILSCGAAYYAAQGGSNFESVDKILKCDPSNENYSEVLNVLMFDLKYFSKRNLIIWPVSTLTTL